MILEMMNSSSQPTATVLRLSREGVMKTDENQFKCKKISWVTLKTTRTKKWPTLPLKI